MTQENLRVGVDGNENTKGCPPGGLEMVFHGATVSAVFRIGLRKVRLLCALMLLSGCVGIFGLRAFAQGVGATGDGIASNPSGERHMSPMGKPCLAFEAYATPQLVNKRIYEHWVKVSNGCGQYIKVKVCYKETDECIVMNVPPWESTSSVLGIYPNLGFQYDFKEHF